MEVLLYYLYTDIGDPTAEMERQRQLCTDLELLGRIIIAEEGINGTVCGESASTQEYAREMTNNPVYHGIEFKVELSETQAFPKLSIKVRDEIVTLGLASLGKEDIDPRELTGTKLNPAQFKEAMNDPNTVLLDGRNNYESELGHFEGAICPDIKNFRDFPEWLEQNKEKLQDKTVLTYCTGGIRCEKLSGLLLREGIDDVYQLDGGIVTYGQAEGIGGHGFVGKNYVFDQRVVTDVTDDSENIVSLCAHCAQASPRYRNCAWAPCNDQFFLCENCEESFGKFCSTDCRDLQKQKLKEGEIS